MGGEVYHVKATSQRIALTTTITDNHDDVLHKVAARNGVDINGLFVIDINILKAGI